MTFAEYGFFCHVISFSEICALRARRAPRYGTEALVVFSCESKNRFAASITVIVHSACPNALKKAILCFGLHANLYECVYSHFAPHALPGHYFCHLFALFTPRGDNAKQEISAFGLVRDIRIGHRQASSRLADLRYYDTIPPSCRFYCAAESNIGGDSALSMMLVRRQHLLCCGAKLDRLNVVFSVGRRRQMVNINGCRRWCSGLRWDFVEQHCCAVLDITLLWLMTSPSRVGHFSDYDFSLVAKLVRGAPRRAHPALRRGTVRRSADGQFEHNARRAMRLGWRTLRHVLVATRSFSE